MNLPTDPFVLELLPEFIEDWLEKLNTEYVAFYSKKDSEAMYRFAHTIKGSAYQFGFGDLGDLGVKMMAQVKSDDWAGLEQNKELFRKGLEEIRDYLNKAKD
jgi:chemotaxis protein histidine kinase CheA